MCHKIKLIIEYLSEEVYEEYAHKIRDMKVKTKFGELSVLNFGKATAVEPDLRYPPLHNISHVPSSFRFKKLMKNSFDTPIYLKLEDVKLPGGILFYIEGE